MSELNVQYDEDTDILKVDGVEFHGNFFRYFDVAPNQSRLIQVSNQEGVYKSLFIRDLIQMPSRLLEELRMRTSAELYKRLGVYEAGDGTMKAGHDTFQPLELE